MSNMSAVNEIQSDSMSPILTLSDNPDAWFDNKFNAAMQKREDEKKHLQWQ